MILALLVLVQAAPPPPAAPEEDIVVIARRLNAWRGTITTGSSGTRCVTRKSTGDREIDRIGCTAMERCWPDILPRIQAAQAKGVARPDRKRLEKEAVAAFAACIKPQREALIEERRARRAAGREAGA